MSPIGTTEKRDNPDVIGWTSCWRPPRRTPYNCHRICNSAVAPCRIFLNDPNPCYPCSPRRSLVRRRGDPWPAAPEPRRRWVKLFLLFLAEFLESGIGIRLAKFLRFTSCYLLGPTCSGPESNCWKSGRLRIGSHTGSIFKRAMDTSSPAGMESKRRSLLIASSGAPARASICASPIWKPGPSTASFSIGTKSRPLSGNA